MHAGHELRLTSHSTTVSKNHILRWRVDELLNVIVSELEVVAVAIQLVEALVRRAHIKIVLILLVLLLGIYSVLLSYNCHLLLQQILLLL